MMKKQNFICVTDKIRKTITNTKIRQSNIKDAQTVLYFAEKMIDFGKVRLYSWTFLVEKVILFFNLTNIIFNCAYIE